MGVKIGGKDIKSVAHAGQFIDHLTQATPAAKKQVVASAHGTTNTTKSVKGQPVLQNEQQHEVAKGLMFPLEDMATIHVQGSRTFNLGNYESLKFECGITLPCMKDDLEKSYEFATSWVSDKIDEVEKQVKN